MPPEGLGNALISIVLQAFPGAHWPAKRGGVNRTPSVDTILFRAIPGNPPLHKMIANLAPHRTRGHRTLDNEFNHFLTSPLASHHMLLFNTLEFQ